MLVTEALTRLQTRLQAPFGTFWSEAEAVFALTEATRVWQGLTAALELETTLPVGAGTVWVDTPRQILTPERVALDGGAALEQYSVSELDAEFGDWEAATPGTPLRWAPLGAALFALHPPPSTDIVLRVEGPEDVQALGTRGTIRVGDEDMGKLLGYAHSPYLTFKEAPGELSTDTIGELVMAAGDKNERLRRTDMYMRFAGRDREEAQRQEGTGKQGGPSIGGRS